MKKKIGWTSIAFAAMLMVSCQTMEVVQLGSTTLVYGDDISAICENQQLFTKVVASSYYKDPNRIIGEIIANNLTKPKMIEKLPISFKRRKSIVSFDKDSKVFEYYLREGEVYKQYSFIVSIDDSELKKFAELTFDYEDAMDKGKYWEKEADDAVNPLIEKIRRVPYTSYMPVSRPVTHYTWDGKPYTIYTLVQEPYTAYRSESYMVPNPKYDPTSVEKYRSYALSYFTEAKRVGAKIDDISFFGISFKD